MCLLVQLTLQGLDLYYFCRSCSCPVLIHNIPAILDLALQQLTLWKHISPCFPILRTNIQTVWLVIWPGWLARAHLHPRNFYPFQKTLLPIRLIVSYEYDPWGSLLAFVPHLPLMSSRDARQDQTGFTNVLSRVALKCAPLVPLGAPCHTFAGRPRPYRVPVWPIWGPRVTYR